MRKKWLAIRRGCLDGISEFVIGFHWHCLGWMDVRYVWMVDFGVRSGSELDFDLIICRRLLLFLVTRLAAQTSSTRIKMRGKYSQARFVLCSRMMFAYSVCILLGSSRLIEEP
jgi:hypothetical protein